MNRNLSLIAFLAGALAVAWVGLGYVGSHPLALTFTVLIGAVYAMGSLEMLRFRQATAGLAAALEAIPGDLPRLDDWLVRVPPSLRHAVRLRIEGDRVGLPGPALTPYLVALLVMLGMLGTFLGMVVTLSGAVLALESTTDLATIRASLASPIKGLGLAFGTSVAGVAASAMLGLVSALCRRERQEAGQRLDARIATALRPFSHAHLRQETFQALQVQARVLPAVAEQLHGLMAALERQGEQLGQRMLASQADLLRDIRGIHADLAGSVDRSLKESLGQSVRIAGETIQPLVASTLAGLADQTDALHRRTADTVEARLDGLAGRLEASATNAAAAWTEALATLRADLAARDGQRLSVLTGSMDTMAASLRQEWQQAGAQTLARQQEICTTLDRTAREITGQAQVHARETIAEIARLMDAAAEAPRAAAEVIAQLREQMAGSTARDRELLEERGRILTTLDGLLEAIGRSAAEQRAAIDSLVAAATATLDRVGGRFTEQVEAGSGRLAELAARVSAGAVEVSSLGEAFGGAARLFAEANGKLVDNLQRIEAALDRTAARGDEQLAYYVAQAREVIDLSLLSQKQIMDELRQLAATPRTPAAEVC